MRTAETVIRDALFGCGLDQPGRVEVPEIMAALKAEGYEIVSPPMVVTTEQLDALPFLTLIREIFKPSPGSGADYGGVYERRSSGWHPIAGTYKDAADNGRPRLPCRVLYNPKMSK